MHPERAAITVGFSKKDGGAPCDCVMLGPWRNHEDSASKWCSSAGDDDLDSADCALTNKVPLEVRPKRLGSVVKGEGWHFYLDVSRRADVNTDMQVQSLDNMASEGWCEDERYTAASQFSEGCR